MSNFKLTDEAKQILIKALAFCDDEIVKQNKDYLTRRINGNQINDSDELSMYYAYLFPALKEYCSVLKRGLDDEIAIGEGFQSTRAEYRLACKLRDAVSNFTNIG